jgi:VanZ family protein
VFTKPVFRTAGIGIIVSIWVLSLIPLSQSGIPGTDKFHHAFAYFACMFCWGQAFTRPATRLKLALIFMAMGALIECVQGLTTYRTFEWMDMVANAVGVTIAWLVVTVQLSIQRRYAIGETGREMQR